MGNRRSSDRRGKHITVSGLRDIMKNFTTASTKIQDAVAAAVFTEAIELIGDAKKRTPVDIGRLRDTGYASPPVNGSRGPASEAGFGTKYAYWVHEVLDAFHPVGGPKFLESVVIERKRGYRPRMGARIWNLYKSGTGVTALSPNLPSGRSNE